MSVPQTTLPVNRIAAPLNDQWRQRGRRRPIAGAGGSGRRLAAAGRRVGVHLEQVIRRRREEERRRRRRAIAERRRGGEQRLAPLPSAARAVPPRCRARSPWGPRPGWDVERRWLLSRRGRRIGVVAAPSAVSTDRGASTAATALNDASVSGPRVGGRGRAGRPRSTAPSNPWVGLLQPLQQTAEYAIVERGLARRVASRCWRVRTAIAIRSSPLGAAAPPGDRPRRCPGAPAALEVHAPVGQARAGRCPSAGTARSAAAAAARRRDAGAAGASRCAGKAGLVARRDPRVAPDRRRRLEARHPALAGEALAGAVCRAGRRSRARRRCRTPHHRGEQRRARPRAAAGRAAPAR